MLILAKADLVKREEIDMICKQISVQENIPVYSTANTVCIMSTDSFQNFFLLKCYKISKI